MKKLLVVVALLFSGLAQAQNQCGLNTFGGPDAFPWGLAQPFPWNTIQGLWKVTTDKSTIIKFKVTLSDSQTKKLAVEVYSKGFNRCDKPLMTGFGIITASEKNIVRVSLKDVLGNTKLLTLAWFESDSLKLTGSNCDHNVLVASLINLNDDAAFADTGYQQIEAPQMMLKKISGTLDFYCKKRK